MKIALPFLIDNVMKYDGVYYALKGINSIQLGSLLDLEANKDTLKQRVECSNPTIRKSI